GLRAGRPMVARCPADSAFKFMASVIRAPVGDLTLHAAGATGAVLPLATHVWDGTTVVELNDERREALRAATDQLAASGLRTLLVAARPFGEGDETPDEDTLLGEVRDLTVLAVLGIVDPPRPQAAEAIRIAHEAGISVHMITGDHLVTASAIARDLGIGGEAVSGADLDRIDDDELSARAAR